MLAMLTIISGGLQESYRPRDGDDLSKSCLGRILLGKSENPERREQNDSQRRH
jgi:hypothetical protein